MARIRSRDTGPELAVRRALHAAGLRYRLHVRGMPGTPDMVLPGQRAVVEVRGCFWHQHPGCRNARLPATRRDYWLPKLARTVERDRAVEGALQATGWTVLVAWGCEVRCRDFLAGLMERVRAIPRLPRNRLQLLKRRTPQACAQGVRLLKNALRLSDRTQHPERFA